MRGGSKGEYPKDTWSSSRAPAGSSSSASHVAGLGSLAEPEKRLLQAGRNAETVGVHLAEQALGRRKVLGCGLAGIAGGPGGIPRHALAQDKLEGKQELGFGIAHVGCLAQAVPGPLEVGRQAFQIFFVEPRAQRQHAGVPAGCSLGEQLRAPGRIRCRKFALEMPFGEHDLGQRAALGRRLLKQAEATFDVFGDAVAVQQRAAKPEEILGIAGTALRLQAGGPAGVIRLSGIGTLGLGMQRTGLPGSGDPLPYSSLRVVSILAFLVVQ